MTILKLGVISRSPSAGQDLCVSVPFMDTGMFRMGAIAIAKKILEAVRNTAPPVILMAQSMMLGR